MKKANVFTAALAVLTVGSFAFNLHQAAEIKEAKAAQVQALKKAENATIELDSVANELQGVQQWAAEKLSDRDTELAKTKQQLNNISHNFDVYYDEYWKAYNRADSLADQLQTATAENSSLQQELAALKDQPAKVETVTVEKEVPTADPSQAAEITALSAENAELKADINSLIDQLDNFYTDNAAADPDTGGFIWDQTAVNAETAAQETGAAE